MHVQPQQHWSRYRLSLKPEPLQSAEAAVSASAGRITAWDIPDSLRLGHEYAADVALRRALCDAPLSARLTFARDGSVRIQVCVGRTMSWCSGSAAHALRAFMCLGAG